MEFRVGVEGLGVLGWEFRVWVLGFRALRNGNRNGSYDYGFRIRGLAFQICGSVVVRRKRLV